MAQGIQLLSAVNETSGYEKKKPIALVGDLTYNLEALWVTTSKYVRIQYVNNMGWFWKSCCLLK